MSSLLADYLTFCNGHRHLVTVETGFYPGLLALLNGIGKDLKPKVQAMSHPKNQGAGIPDIGLFTPDQLRKGTDTGAALQSGLVPSRGVVEVKPAQHSLDALIASPQVRKYLDRYNPVLVTNLWQFQLVDLGPNGQKRPLERFSIVDDVQAFWNLCAHPQSDLAKKVAPSPPRISLVALGSFQIASTAA